MLSRREMMRLFLASLAVSKTTACSQNIAEYISQSGQKHVFVIGAGIAGLKAAQDLKTVGFDVTVIEARDRIGGRTLTDNSLGKPLDLGASWIHGTHGNPISDLARRLGTPLHEWDYEKAELINLHRDGGPILSFMLRQVEQGLYRAFDRLSAEDITLTVADVVAKLRHTDTFKGFTQQEIDFAIHMVVELNEAADASEASALGAHEGKAFGGADVLLEKGYGVLIDHLAEGLDIRLSERVTEIDYGGSRAVVCTSKDVYLADYILCTVPLGVLKQHQIDFYPDLPEQKQAAISGLEMGLLNKVFLRFETPFWNEETNCFLRLPDSGMRWSNWSNLSNLHGAPILFAMHSGQEAKRIERLSDSDIVADALASLRTMFSKDVPEPNGYLITRWGQDPYALGAYAFVKPGHRPAIREDLAAPLKQLLFFAGEATSSQYPGTVHGAFLSGKAAAGSIVDEVESRIAEREKAEKARAKSENKKKPKKAKAP